MNETRVTPEQGGIDTAAPTYAGRWVSARIRRDFLTTVDSRTHALHADEPLPLGGRDLGMTPYELLLASLSSCMAITMRMYANRKGWPFEKAYDQLRTAPSRDPDREVRIAGVRNITRIERRIELAGPLAEEQRNRLLEIADRCPIKRNLEAGLEVVSAPEGQQ
jgi:putative redox protein